MVHFKKFTNIDLFKQGYYQVRTSVLNAQPYLQFNSVNENVNEMNIVDVNRQLFEAFLGDQYFYTQGFIIKYEEEEMPLNIGCIFRSYETQQKVKILVELLFVDLRELRDYSKMTQKEMLEMSQVVSRCDLVIDEVLKMNSAFYPLDFDAEHRCLLETVLHSIPIKSDDSEDSIQILTNCRKELNKQLSKVEQVYQQTYETENTLYSLHSDMYTSWIALFKAMETKYDKFQDSLTQDYVFNLKNRFCECVQQNKTEVLELHQSRKSGKEQQQYVQQQRLKEHLVNWNGIKYEQLLIPLNVHPYLLKCTSLKQGKQWFQKNAYPIHYIVLVHGYQGQSYDMRLWKSYLTIKQNQALRIISPSCNDCTSNRDIDDMGERLANEVSSIINDDDCKEFRLSFICHSIGGLVVRAALPKLNAFKDNMHSYVTLASPHAGYASSQSGLVDTGMWFIQKWTKCITLEQLQQKDHKDPKKTLLFKLSNYIGLDWFTNVVLLGSYQDLYVPYHSARLETIEGKAVYNQMVQNILSRLSKVDRFDVNFVMNKKYILQIKENSISSSDEQLTSNSQIIHILCACLFIYMTNIFIDSHISMLTPSSIVSA